MNLYRDDFRCQYSKSDGGCHPGSCMSVRSGVFLRPKMASCADFKFGRLNRIGGERLPQTDSLRYREVFFVAQDGILRGLQIWSVKSNRRREIAANLQFALQDTARLY